MSAFEILAAILLFCMAGGILALLVLPLILVFTLFAVLAKVGIVLLMLPFRLIGWTLGLGFTAAGFLLKGVALTGVVALLIVVGLLPLIPLVLFGGLVYLLARR